MTTAQETTLTITEQAAAVRPSQVFLTVVTAVFVGAGWAAGTLWLSVAWLFIGAWRALTFCGVAVRYGYRQGAHVPRASEPPAGRGGPGQ